MMLIYLNLWRSTTSTFLKSAQIFTLLELTYLIFKV